MGRVRSHVVTVDPPALDDGAGLGQGAGGAPYWDRSGPARRPASGTGRAPSSDEARPPGTLQASCSRSTPMIRASFNMLFFASVSLGDGPSLMSRDQEGGRSQLTASTVPLWRTAQ